MATTTVWSLVGITASKIETLMRWSFGLLLGCSIVTFVAFWFSGGPGPERLPDLTGGLRIQENCRSVPPVSQLFTDPRLDCGPAEADESYRVAWYAAFDTAPVKVMVNRTGVDVVVIAQDYEKRDGGRVLHLTSEERRRIALPEWTEVRTMIANVGFWQMDPVEPCTVQDGASSTIEGRGVGTQFAQFLLSQGHYECSTVMSGPDITFNLISSGGAKLNSVHVVDGPPPDLSCTNGSNVLTFRRAAGGSANVKFVIAIRKGQTTCMTMATVLR